jgi:predicted nucleotidyltransferase
MKNITKIAKEIISSVTKYEALAIVRNLLEEPKFKAIMEVHLAGSLSRSHTGNDLDLLVTIKLSAEAMIDLVFEFADAIQKKLTVSVDMMVRRDPKWDRYFAEKFSDNFIDRQKSQNPYDFGIEESESWSELNADEQKQALEAVKKIYCYIIKIEENGGFSFGYWNKPIYSISINEKEKLSPHYKDLTMHAKHILDKMILGWELVTRTDVYKSTGTTYSGSLKREYKDNIVINFEDVKILQEKGYIKKSKEEPSKNSHVTRTYWELTNKINGD